MASTTTSLINFNFGGISRKDSSFSSELITCSDCQNVELYYTGLNSGIGIRTAKGNEAITKYKELDPETQIEVVKSQLADNEYVVGIFESNLGGNEEFIVYTEDDTEGKLYVINAFSGNLDLKKNGLSVTKKACGCDFMQGYLDVFCFSNGIELQYLIYDNDPLSPQIGIEALDMSTCTLVDEDGRTVSGLGMYTFDNRVWIFNDKVLWYSEQLNCKNFRGETGTAKITTAGYIEYGKPVTAIHPYLGTLAVFHKDSSQLVTVDKTTGFANTDESPGGCASYDALVFHGTDLYFYDDTKKGVFSFQQIVNGDKTLGQNIAYDIQEELLKIKDLDRIRTLSVVTSDRNEVWFLVPISGQSEYSIILIYDYIRGGWVKRKCQHINCIGVVDSTLYSGGKDIYREYSSNRFDGEFIQSSYTCTIFNMGADNTLKITKFPPRITASAVYDCRFWVKYIKNYNEKKVKEKYITAKYQSKVKKWNDGTIWNNGETWKVDSTNFIVKLPSATFKALEITFETRKESDEFCFRSIEFSKIKVKQI